MILVQVRGPRSDPNSFFHPIQLKNLKKLNWIFFFFFIQTGPNTPLYANSSLTRVYFFSPLLPFSFVGLQGGATKKKLVLQL